MIDQLETMGNPRPIVMTTPSVMVGRAWDAPHMSAYGISCHLRVLMAWSEGEDSKEASYGEYEHFPA